VILLVILAFFVTFYNGSDNSGIVLGTESCHIGVEVTPKASIFALCYIPDNSPDTGA